MNLINVAVSENFALAVPNVSGESFPEQVPPCSPFSGTVRDRPRADEMVLSNLTLYMLTL